MEITPLGPVLGAQISGVNVGELSDEHFETIRRALVDYEVLVFPEQHIGPRRRAGGEQIESR